MPASKKINLKDHVKDGEIDLSLCNLQEVPVKEIATMKKAKSLDLSNNRLVTLSKNFITLTHITKLDLSQNLLTKLPEDFGEMKQLKHLDLYNNKLQYLPVSMYKLKSLRWLDLKNNPLLPSLQKVAGPCLEASQCVKCAKDVVAFFSNVNETIEEKKATEKKEEAKAELKDAEPAKKKKEKKPKSKKTNAVSEAPKATVKNSKKPAKSGSKRKVPSKFSPFKFILYTVIIPILSLFLFCSYKHPVSDNLRSSISNNWQSALQHFPESVEPWAAAFGNHVAYLSLLTEKFLTKAFIYCEEFRQSETVQAIWETLIKWSIEFKKLLFHLGDQALIWTNEIKKKIV